LQKKFGRGGRGDFVGFAGVFEGCFGKSGVKRVVFCGEVMVKCVTDVDGGTAVFG
jgi:hypothetical protein